MTALEDRTNPTPTVNIAAVGSVGEASGTGEFVFTRTETSGTLSVGATLSGTAGFGMDYSYSPLIVFFADGIGTVGVTVSGINDSNVEGTETITYTIPSSGSYNIGTGSATLNLYDDDTVQVTVSKQGSDPTEGGNGTFRITRSGSTSGNLTVNYTVGGNATSGTDYTSIGGVMSKHIVGLCIAAVLFGTCRGSRGRADEPANFKSFQGAEVHVIGIYETQHSYLPMKDVASWRRLVRPLLKQTGPAKRVWELLDKAAREACADDEIFEEQLVARTTQLRNKVRSALEKILANPDFYSKESFKDVKLTEDVTKLLDLGKNRSFVQTLRLNRALLSLALPDAFKDVPEDYHGVSVKVNGGKKVILVLSSYNACRWSVEVDKGSDVVGVILGGYYTQEVVGIKAPVIYRAHDGPDGKWTKFQSVNAYSEEHRNYEAFMALIKSLTGKTPDSFQGNYRAPKDGYCIPAQK